ncbi:MAG: hypothetical protein K9I85_06245 [Saprospiraceae bacterium]|nr:hypothetical protein [Saprospiraceae bacterium]
MMRIMTFILLGSMIYALGSCSADAESSDEMETQDSTALAMQALLGKYTSVKLTTDMAALSASERQMIPLLIEVAKIMDSLFWQEAYGDRDELLASIENEDMGRFAVINYGPWDRLGGNAPFVPGVGEKPAGARYYPEDMTKEEFEAAELPGKADLYTFIRRNENGDLMTIHYHEMFADQIGRAAALLDQAAELAEDAGLKKYLTMRAEALRTDNYQPSDLAWMDMKDNHIDFVVGPIETYEDQLFGYKASHEAYVLVKDMEWSQRLEKYAAFMPELQKGLPCADKYKKEKPGGDAQLNAYDVIYYSGDCNAGSKTIAINLPNDEEVQLKKGTRRLQLKNAMRAKFDKILIPIAQELIDPSQQKHVIFDAFFANTMFHEVAHGLGIKNTINGKGSVREAIKEHSSALEEGKADILGLYMVNQLFKKGELTGATMEDYYVTFMASIFRSVRFGASSAHGKANMIRFNFFQEYGAFVRDDATGTYKINFENLQKATDALGALILQIQGDGAYQQAADLVAQKGQITPQLQADLDRLSEKGIPVDVVYEQGVEALGL